MILSSISRDPIGVSAQISTRCGVVEARQAAIVEAEVETAEQAPVLRMQGVIHSEITPTTVCTLTVSRLLDGGRNDERR